MDAPRSESASGRYDELHAEAAEALGYAANTVRGIRDRYRAAYFEELARWQTLRDDLGTYERTAITDGAPGASGAAATPASTNGSTNGSGNGSRPHVDGDTLDDAAAAAEAGAADLRLKMLRGEADRARAELARHETELSRIDLAIRNLESTWLFLERGDTSLVTDEDLPAIPTELRMRIVEAQEAERARLAQEVHDGPAQALSNAIFQVEFIDRVLDSDPQMARSEIGFMRELLRRELGDVRAFIGHLRPPVLVELGLEGSISDAVRTHAALSSVQIGTQLDGSTEGLSEAAQTAALRVVQEALQNVRKHAGAANVVVATSLSGGEWILEVRDDGRGFDTGAVAARGRRNFGLQFMRERAELVGAQFEVRSRPEAGTVVRLAIPVPEKENG